MKKVNTLALIMVPSSSPRTEIWWPSSSWDSMEVSFEEKRMLPGGSSSASTCKRVLRWTGLGPPLHQGFDLYMNELKKFAVQAHIVERVDLFYQHVRNLTDNADYRQNWSESNNMGMSPFMGIIDHLPSWFGFDISDKSPET